MYVSISGEKVIQADEIVAIFEGNVSKSNKNSPYFEEHQRRVSVLPKEMNKPKSYIVSSECLYESPISPATLRKRIQAGHVR